MMETYNIYVPPDLAEEVAERIAECTGRNLRCVVSGSSIVPGVVLVMSSTVFYPSHRHSEAASYVWDGVTLIPVQGAVYESS